MDTEISVEDLEKSPKFSWLVRPCEKYEEEYKDCTSIKAKFQNYYVYGEAPDCSQWKIDHDKCLDYRKEKDMNALNDLIDSERSRWKKRMEGHYQNDVWERRKSPPEDWNKPVPEEFTGNPETSYLALKAKEMKEGKYQHESTSLCTIM